MVMGDESGVAITDLQMSILHIHSFPSPPLP